MNSKKKALLIGIAAALFVGVIAAGAVFVAASRVPTATAGSVYEDALSLQTYYDNPQYALKTLPTLFGLSKEQAESVLNDKEEWKAYSIEIAFDNRSKEDITIYSFEVKRNGKDGVWLSLVANGEIGILEGNKENISVNVLVNGKDVSKEDAAAAIKKFDIKIVYSKTPSENNEGVESIENKKTVNVK